MMTAIRSSRVVGPISICLAAMMMLVLIPPTSVMPSAEAAQQSRLVLFPVLDESGSDYEDVARRATDYFQMALNEVEEFQVMEFSRTSPSVLRAVEEGRIRAVDLEIEVSDPVIAIELGFALDADEVCLITIQSVETREDPVQVEVLVNGQVFNVAENVDPETMHVVERPRPSNTFGVAGKSRVRDGYDAATAPLLREALRDAATRAAEVLSGKPAVVVDEEPRERTRLDWGWIAAAALIAGLVLVTDTSRDRPEAPPTGAVAPTPEPLRGDGSAITLHWRAPQTDLTLLGYDLRRSTDGGRTWNAVPGSDTLRAQDTRFDDFNVQEGVGYRYKIRAKYAETAPSHWALFNQFEFRISG